MASDWEQKRQERRAAYIEKLKDPRWQKRRLEILERDKWRCVDCGDTERTLHVHHYWYEGSEPWEHPDESMATLCEECHDIETGSGKKEEQELIRIIRAKRFRCSDIAQLAHAVYNAKPIVWGDEEDSYNWSDLIHMIHGLVSDVDGHVLLLKAHGEWMKSKQPTSDPFQG